MTLISSSGAATGPITRGLWHPRRMELAHEREGSGPPLVLLAGIGMNATAWKPVRPLLAAERELTLIDLPGFGNSTALPMTPTRRSTR